jgi:hypothetical protein
MYLAGFEVISAAATNITVFWDVTPCSLVDAYNVLEERAALNISGL